MTVSRPGPKLTPAPIIPTWSRRPIVIAPTRSYGPVYEDSFYSTMYWMWVIGAFNQHPTIRNTPSAVATFADVKGHDRLEPTQISKELLLENLKQTSDLEKNLVSKTVTAAGKLELGQTRLVDKDESISLAAPARRTQRNLDVGDTCDIEEGGMVAVRGFFATNGKDVDSVLLTYMRSGEKSEHACPPGASFTTSLAAAERFPMAQLVEAGNDTQRTPEQTRHIVESLYHDHLLRAPDAAGVEGWIKSHGNAPREKLVHDFLQTPEAVVVALYEEVLGREPDADGRHAYTQHLTNGMSAQAVEESMKTSPEGVVAGAYLRCLLRKPDKEGLDAWIRTLNETKRPARVAQAICDSNEGFVATLYAESLHRMMTPEERTGRKDQLDRNEISRRRMRNDVAYSNEATVVSYYIEYLDRIPNKEERDGWIQVIEQQGKNAAYKGIAYSDEARKRR